MVANTGCVSKIASLFVSIVLCGGHEGVFLSALGDWYVGDSFVATLWLVLITAGKVVAPKFGSMGMRDEFTHFLVDGPGMHLKWSTNDEFSVFID